MPTRSDAPNNSEDRQRVVNDQAELAGVRFALLGVGAVPGLANTERQVFGRSGLHHKAGFEIGFVVLAAIQFHAQVAEGLDGKTDGTLSEARAVVGEKTCIQSRRSPAPCLTARLK